MVFGKRKIFPWDSKCNNCGAVNSIAILNDIGKCLNCKIESPIYKDKTVKCKNCGHEVICNENS